MRALTWHGRHDVRVETVPDPEIVNPRDAILRVTSTAICGSDLHLYDGYIPTHARRRHPRPRVHGRSGRDRRRRARSRRASASSCRSRSAAATASSARSSNIAACDNSNPSETSDASELMMGHPMGGAFGYAHLTGGYAGGQAEYVRVPYLRRRADRRPRPSRRRPGAVPVATSCRPAGWRRRMRHRAGRHGRGVGLRPGRAVRDPVGADHGRAPGDRHRPLSARLELAKQLGAEILDYREVDVREALDEMTGGIGPDACIDCVGMESHGLTDRQYRRHGEGAHVPRHRAAARASPERSSPAARAGAFRFRASMAGSPTSSRSAQMMEKGLTLKTGPDPRPEIHQAAARADRAGEDRHDLPDLAPRAARAGGRDVPPLARRAGHLHQDRPQDRNGRARRSSRQRESASRRSRAPERLRRRKRWSRRGQRQTTTGIEAIRPAGADRHRARALALLSVAAAHGARAAVRRGGHRRPSSAPSPSPARSISGFPTESRCWSSVLLIVGVIAGVGWLLGQQLAAQLDALTVTLPRRARTGRPVARRYGLVASVPDVDRAAAQQRRDIGVALRQLAFDRGQRDRQFPDRLLRRRLPRRRAALLSHRGDQARSRSEARLVARRRWTNPSARCGCG